MFPEYGSGDPLPSAALREQGVLGEQGVPGNQGVLRDTTGDETKLLAPAALRMWDAVLAAALPPVPQLSAIKAVLEAQYGVSLVSGQGEWTAGEAAQILAELEHTPQWDLPALEDCWLYREGALVTDQGKVEARSHYQWDEARDGKALLGVTDVRHVHFYDAAFKRRPFFGTQDQATALHELGHIRMEAALVRRNRRLFLDTADTFIALHGEADSRQAALRSADTDTPMVKEFVQRLRERWTAHYAALSRTVGSLKQKLEYLWAYSDLFERFEISKKEMEGYLGALDDAWGACEALGSFFAGARNDVDKEIKALADLLLATRPPERGGFDPELRGRCTAFLTSCDQLVGTGLRMMKYAIEYGGSSRYLEYFRLLARKSRFQPFTAYAGTSMAEWFAETYQLAALAPGDLARLSPPVAEWFVTRELAFPLHLNKFTSSEFP